MQNLISCDGIISPFSRDRVSTSLKDISFISKKVGENSNVIVSFKVENPSTSSQTKKITKVQKKNEFNKFGR